MDMPAASSIVPFVPSGPDYALARAFFRELGFEELWEDDGYAGFRSGAVGFVLQRLAEPLEGYCMMQLHVPDLAAWWAAFEARSIAARYPQVRVRAPTDFPWGREVHIADMGKVSWRIREGW
jgi:hypothetical protein